MNRGILLIISVLLAFFCSAKVPRTNNHGFLLENHKTKVEVTLPDDSVQTDTVREERDALPPSEQMSAPQQTEDSIVVAQDSLMPESRISKQEMAEEWMQQHEGDGFVKWTLILGALALTLYVIGIPICFLFAIAGVIVGIIGMEKYPHKKKKMVLGLVVSALVLLTSLISLFLIVTWGLLFI